MKKQNQKHNRPSGFDFRKWQERWIRTMQGKREKAEATRIVQNMVGSLELA